MSGGKITLPWLDPDPSSPFPPVSTALHDPNGLLAGGGDLHPQRLLNAYRHGIFPWYSEGEPILWWCPGPRAVFHTADFRLNTRFRRDLRRSDWIVRADTHFAAVIAACAEAPRPGQDGTWISAEMQSAYRLLHRQGHAHSVEVYAEGDGEGNRLVGGIYGLAIGRMFFGESMFSLESGGSKVALAALARYLHDRRFPLIDCQVENPHLRSLGAGTMALPAFLARVADLTAEPGLVGSWTADFGVVSGSDLAVRPPGSRG
jgi:leucyl/phenylalanyl-tRNA---protein transferase